MNTEPEPRRTAGYEFGKGVFRSVVLFLFLGGGWLLFPMDWPSPAGVMKKNFGWNEEGLPELGVTFSSEGPVSAAEKGELLCQRQESDTASRLPSPLGAWIAVDHGDGIISIYSRMDSTNSPPVPDSIEKGKTLGEAGLSGRASQKGFFFQLFDRKERRWINPGMIIRSQEDTRPPAIISVLLKDAKGNSIDPSQVKNLSQGRYLIYVNAVDTLKSPNESPLAPFKIVCALNGSEAGTLNFDTYSARDGVLMVYRNGLVPVRQVYAPFPAYEAADVWLSRGQNTLEIIVQDIAGNARNVVFKLQAE